MHYLQRDLNSKKSEIESLRKISELELQRLKDIHSAQIEELDGTA